MRIAFIMTSFNRVDKTKKCIGQLLQMMKKENVEGDIYLVDDNSTDGTYETIQTLYPSVKLYKSIGNLYWGRGMYKAWMEALKDYYDAYVWVNDDNNFYEYALNEMIACAACSHYKAIICGSFCSKEGLVTYGGADKNMKKIKPNGTMQEVYYMNGNFVLIPAEVVKKIGIIDPTFKHIKGDFDYGLSAIENGIHVLSTTRFIGISPQNPIGKSRNRFWGKSCKDRIKDSFNSPFLENPSISLYFNIKHNVGVIRSTAIFIKSLIVLVIPDRVYEFIRSIKKNR